MQSIQANEIIQDVEAARAAMKRHGYLLIRGLFDQEQIRGIRMEILGMFNQAGILAEGSELREGRSIPRGQISNEQFHSLLLQAYALESIHELWHGSNIKQVMQALIGKTDVIPHPHKQVRFQFPSESGISAQVTDPHQDYVYNQGSTEMYSCWAALGDLTPMNGVLEVLENSHNRGLLSVYAPTPGSITYSIDEEDLQGTWLTSEYLMGDAVVFHSYTVHRVPANLSSVARLSTDCRFQSISEPFNARWMTPLPGVIEASHNWSNKGILNYLDNLDLILVEHDESYFNNMKPAKTNQ